MKKTGLIAAAISLGLISSPTNAAIIYELERPGSGNFIGERFVFELEDFVVPDGRTIRPNELTSCSSGFGNCTGIRFRRAGGTDILNLFSNPPGTNIGVTSNFIFEEGIFSQTGTFSTIFSPNATLTITDTNAMNAVPEPSTWAFLILGFGLIGAAMRQRSSWPVRVTYT